MVLSGRIPPAASPGILAAAVLPLVLLLPCGTRFAAGDLVLLESNCNGDARTDISDAIFLVDFLFMGGRDPRCDALCDYDQDGRLDLSDVINVLQLLLWGTGQPAHLSPDPCPDLEISLSWDPVVTDIRGEPEAVVTYRIYGWTEITSATQSPIFLLKEAPGDSACTVLSLEEMGPLLSGSRHYLFVTAVDPGGNESVPSDPVEIDG